MKITVNDIEEVMDMVKTEPSKDVLIMTAELNGQLAQTKGYLELVQTISTMILSKSFGKEQDVHKILMDCAGIAVMAGALLGFRLGLRESGLEMGIGPEDTEEKK